MSAELDEPSKRGSGRVSARIVDLDDPALGDEAGEFQGHHLGAGVSIIVVDAPPGDSPRLHRYP